MAEGVRESDFEYDVVKSLGRSEEYTPLDRSLYDKDLCLIPAEVIAFVKDTQPKEYEQLSKEYGTDTDRKIVENVATLSSSHYKRKFIADGAAFVLQRIFFSKLFRSQTFFHHFGKDG